MRIQRRILPVMLLLALAATPALLSGQTGATAAAARLGFSPQRLARIDSYFQGLVDRGEMTGAVVLVLRDSQPAYQRTFGWADKEAARRMTPDAIFRIASQTKAITSTAVLSLVEEGKIALNDPVSKFIPAFARTTVAVKTDTGLAIVPARRPITIRDLMTHTAGISYGTDPLVASLYQAKGLGPAAGWGWYTADKDEPICTTMERLATLPFVAQPGERFVYGYNLDILGCVVERASGMPLDQFIRTRITGPLKMVDTDFFVAPAKKDRLAAVYVRGPDGKEVRAPDGPRGQGNYVEGPRKSFAGGAGITSTARDYGRFLQMLLNGGQLDGVRILGPKTVALMTTNQVGTLYSTEGEGFSLAFNTLDQPGARGRPDSVGTFAWGGAYGSEYQVDPKEHVILVFMTQEVPNASGFGQRLRMLAYQAMMR